MDGEHHAGMNDDLKEHWPRGGKPHPDHFKAHGSHPGFPDETMEKQIGLENLAGQDSMTAEEKGEL